MPKPSARPQKVYWDACAFLSLIEGTPDRLPTLDAVLQEAHIGAVEIYTSTLSIAEVAFAKVEKDGQLIDAAIEARIDKLWLPSSPFKLVDLYAALMKDAKRLMRLALGDYGWSLKPADVIHLATAKRLNVDVFQTYDDKLYKFKDVAGIRIEEPKTDTIVWPAESADSGKETEKA